MSLLQAIVASTASNKRGKQFPDPGDGSPPNSLNTTYGSLGTPYDPGGNISSVSNYAGGFYRTAFLGNWSNTGWNNNPTIFDGTPAQATASDSTIAFNLQNTSDTYCMEWKGYINPTSTDTWNFQVTADDVCMLWLGSAALNPDDNNYLCATQSNSGLNANSVTLTRDQWYPIRIRYQEWSGSESLGIFASPIGTDMIALYQRGWPNMGYDRFTNGYV